MTDTSATLDWLLQGLVDATNNSDMRLSVTLEANGLLVSGKLVSAKDYVAGVVTELNEVGAANVAQLFKTIADLAYSDEQIAARAQELPTFIHLKDARYFHQSGSALPANKPVFWRGRLTEISGFFLGQLTVDSDDDDS